MPRAILGRKIGMTQIFEEVAERDDQGKVVTDDDGAEVKRKTGRVIPVTVIEAKPNVVTQKKTIDRDGYEAVQVGYGEIKESKLNKPRRGHLAKHSVPARRLLREFRGVDAGEIKIGDEIAVDTFRAGDLVDVCGVSKGKGFQGVVKRYHWHGGDMTHGSMVHRKPQSAGATDAARIFKNVGRPGHMGHERVTIRRLRVVRVDAHRNLLLIRGSVPGPNGTIVTIRETK